MPSDTKKQETIVPEPKVKPQIKPVVKGKRNNFFLSRIKRRVLKHVAVIRFLALVGILLVFYLSYLGLSDLYKKTSASFYFGLLSDFVFTPPEQVESTNDRTNVLILGRGGVGHEAPDLTDTMIFASINHKDSRIALISLPRDIWVAELRAKLNSAYYWGNKKQDGGGKILVKSVIENILGQPIHYVLVLDFSAFEKVVNEIGGIEVNVETAFTDTKFPIPGKEADTCDGDPKFLCRYETITFEAGRQYMDGTTALKFVRSRNAEGDEGTDFARSKRQQLVIAGIKEKVLSKEILFSPMKIKSLIKLAQENTETDLDPSTAAVLARRAYDSKNAILSNIFPEELLVNPPKLPQYDNLYIFIPSSKDGGWEDVRSWVECTLSGNEKCLN